MATTPAFVAAGTVTEITGSPHNIPVPASAQEGDLLLLAVWARGGDPAATGWTAEAGLYAVADGSSYFAVAAMLWKIASSTDPSSNVALSSGWPAYGVVLAYRPENRNDPIAATAEANSGASEVSSLDITGPTTIAGNTLAVSVWCSVDDSAPASQSVTPGAGTTRGTANSDANAIGGCVVEDTSSPGSTRSATSASGGLFAGVTAILAGAGGQLNIA